MPRKYHSRFLASVGVRYQSWLQQTARGKLGGSQKTRHWKTTSKCPAWAEKARKRSHNASKLYTKRCTLTKERATELYRLLNIHQIELEQQGMEDWRLRKMIKEEKAIVDAEIEGYQRRQWRAYETSNQEHRKCERYCQEQRQLLRALEDLTNSARAMYELCSPHQSKHAVLQRPPREPAAPD